MTDTPSPHYLAWKRLWDARKRALEELLGPSTDRVWTAIPPFYLGGGSEVLTFLHHCDGATYVTVDLTGPSGQAPNGRGQYELMICTRAQEEWAPNLVSSVARATLDEIFEPAHTMDVRAVLPKHSTLAALLFCDPELLGNTFYLEEARCSLLMCVGITEPELWQCQRGKAGKVFSALKQASVFPYTDLRRKSVL